MGHENSSMCRLLIALALLSMTACFELPPDGRQGAGDAGIDGGMTDAGNPISPDGGIVCAGGSASSFPTFNRACMADNDCTIALHETDCCGSLDAMGIAASETNAFATDEALCESMFPGCGCASDSVKTDQGTSPPAGSVASAIVVHCVTGVCTTSVRPATACDGATCSPTEVCIAECSGVPLPDAGHLPSQCVGVPSSCAASSDCSCYGSTDPCPTGSRVGVQAGAPVCECE